MQDDVVGIAPEKVISPKSRWKLISILHKTKWWSMAFGTWTKDGKTDYVLAQRWNGFPGKKGQPCSRGQAIWFVLPEDTYPLYIDSKFIPEEMREEIRGKLELKQQEKSSTEV